MKNNYEQIEAWTDALYDEVKSIRRDFHKYPEPGWAEIRTSDDTVLRKYFKAGETPVVEFPVPFDQVVFARAYCNKHGAWRAK